MTALIADDYRGAGLHRQLVDVSEWKGGVYFIVFRSERHHLTARLVVH